MANLTKRDLVMQISKQTGLTQQEVFSVIQLTLDGITEALSTGSDVELRNFGVFEVRLTKSRVGRNPNKPEHDVVIPARATVSAPKNSAASRANPPLNFTGGLHSAPRSQTK